MNRFIKRTMILALALAMSLGAWAQQEVLLTTVTHTGQTSYSQSPDGIVTVTLNNIGDYNSNLGWIENGTVTVEAAQGYTITRCVFRQNDKTPLEDNLAPFTATMIDEIVYVETSTGQKNGGVMYGITSIEVYGYPPAGTVTRTSDSSWGFTMPGYNAALNVTYKTLPNLTWFYGTDTMPNEGLTVTRGFHADAIQNISLQVSDMFNTAMRGSHELAPLSAPSTWAMINDNISAADIENFVDNSSLTEEQALAIPNPYPTDLVYIIYGFDGNAAKYILSDGTIVNTVRGGLPKSIIYSIIHDEGGKVYYTASAFGPGLTLRYGSSNPDVVSFSNPNDMTTFSLNGPGTATVYAVFDGNDDFLYDSAYFAVNILDPDTLTLSASGNGSVHALLGGGDATWGDGTDNIVLSNQFTADDITFTINSGGDITSSGQLLGSFSFTSENGNFSRIEMTLTSNYNYTYWNNAEGWTVDANTAVWEGDAQSVVITNCTTYVKQITFVRGGSTDIVALNEAQDTLLVIPGATVQAVAEAQDGNYVSAWSDNRQPGNYTSDTNTITVDETMTLTATFAQNPLLTLATSGQGSVKLDGVTYDTVYTIIFDHTSSHEGSRYFTIPASRMPYDTTFSYNNNVMATMVDEPSGKLRLINQGDHTVTISISGAYEDFGMYTCRLEGTDETDDWDITCTASTVTVYPDGITKTGANTYRVLPGTTVNVTATPGEGSYLAQWSDQTEPVEGDARLGGSHPYTMPAAPATLTATFNEIPVLTLASNDSEWGSVELEGAGSNNGGVTVTFEANGNSFTKENVYLPYTFSCDFFAESEELDLIIKQLYGLEAGFCDNDQAPSASGNANVTAGKSDENHYITISAPFEGTATVTGTYKSRDADYTNIEPFTYTLTISTGSGTTMPAGVTQLTDNTYRVMPGTEVTVNAQATALHHVSGWQDQGGTELTGATYSDYFVTEPENLFPAKSAVTLTVTGNTTARALFGINSYDVSASVAESDDVRGTVSAAYTDPQGAQQSAAAGASLTLTAQGGSTTTLTATPQTGYHFVQWQNESGDSVSNQNPYSVTEAGSYTAVFDTNVYTLTVALCDECTGWGTVTGSGQVKHFLDYPISVTPDIAHFFTQWSNGSTEAFDTVTLVSDSTITATLLPKKILTFAHNEGGQMEFIVPQDVTTFEGIATTSVSQNGITVTAANADADGMYLRNGESINISIAGEVSITQVDFHVTNGTNLVNTIDAQGATVTYTQNNEYGSIMGLNTQSLTISSTTTHDLQIDQLTVHYGRTLPNGVAYSDVDSIFYVMPDTTVIVRAIPDEGHYLVSWSDNAQVIDTLSASITMTQDETLTATFALNPVITLAVSDPAMGSAYFTGYHGNTVTRAGIIKAESIELPYQWYEASEIMSIEGGNGMVTKDANSHYVIVSGVFDGTATVITSTGAFNVTCEPTLPNGVHYNSAADNYTVMPYTVLSLTATVAGAEYHFVDWAKVTATDSTIFDSVAVTTVTIDGDMKLQANFLHNPYRLTLAALPDSMGIVTEISRLPFTSPDTLIKQGWEDGMNGWTMNHCHVTTGIQSGFTNHSGDNLFLFYYTTDYPQYLISPELNSNDSVTLSFWYQAYHSNYPERFQVGYSTTTNDPSAFTFGEEVSTNQTNYQYYENTFPAGTKYLCISCNSNDQYYLLLDDLTITNNTLVAGSVAVVPDTTTPNTYLVMADSTVTIVANANAGYHITGWSNNAEVNSLTSDTIQVTMVSDSTISASFGNNPVVTLAANGNGTVTVESLPDYAIDNQDGTYSVLPGTAFTFVAKPDTHYYMTRWDDIDSMVNSNTAVSRTETIDGDTAFSATFAHKPVLTLAANDTAWGTVTIDGPVGVDNMFDNLVDVIAASSAYQYGVATDGQYIYTSSWSPSIQDGYIFHQYDLAGNLIDNFNIDGVDICRDMTSDGQYIYGANGETVFVLDLAAHTLVNTIQFSGAGTVRHISYDPVRDAFWVGNWSSLMLYSRTGSFIQNGPGVSDVSGTAFYQDDEDHLILLCQPNQNAVVYDYNINQDTITQLIDITSAVGVAGISGGSFIGSVNGTLYWLGDTQGDPNHISVYALGKSGVYALNDTTFIVDYNNDLTMRATAETGYEFLNWEGANGENLGTADSLTVTMTMDTLVHAIFDTLHYQLTVLAADSVMGSVDGSRTATHFIDYEISATPALGYHFVAWNDGDTNNPRTVTLVSDSTFTASFDTNTYVLTVVSADTVMGSVEGSNSAAKHFVGYDIIATPNYGYHFVGWSNDSTADTTTVTLVSDSTFTATFGYNQYTVTGQPATTTDVRGTVTGSATVNYLDTVTLVATAETGYHFAKWVDAANNELDTTDTLRVQALRDSVVYAVFDTNEYQLTVLASDDNMGTVARDTIAKHFLSYEISATANPGYHFVMWDDSVTAATRMVTLTEDMTYTAIFDYDPALTIVYNEQNGHVEFIVDNQIANFTGITGTSLTADGLTVTAQSADDMGMSIKDNQTITIVADSGMIINQVAFHLTNGTNKASLINATAGTVNAANGNAYGAVTDVHNDTVVISSTSDKSINIDQLTIQYAPILPAGVVRLESDDADVYRVNYNTQVSLLAVPADSSYLDSWAGDTTSTNDLVAVVTIDSSDATVYANFHGNPILTLAANGNGRVYFEGYSGYTVNRDETVLATNLTDFPYMWYEAGEISEITGGNGMVYADQTNHYVNVDGAFNGTATVVTTSGAFTVTCIPTVPNGITIMSLDTFSVAPGTEVTVRGEAEAEHYLVNWNDLDSAATVRTVTVNYNTDLVANFLHFPYTLTVNVDTVMGSAAPAEGQTFVTLNADGTYTVMADSTVTLVATADSGYHLSGWVNALSTQNTPSNPNTLTSDTVLITMTSDSTVSINIDTNVYQLIVLAADTNMGVVAGTDSTAKHFLTYSISATPNPGFRFMSWSDGDTNASRTISLTQDSTLTATFDTIHAELAWSAESFTGYTLIDFNSYKPTLSNPNNVEVRFGVVEDSITVNETTGMIGNTVAYGNIATKTGTYTIYAVHDLTNEFFYDSVAYTLTVEQGVVVNISKSIDEGGSALFADRDSLPTLTHHYASGTMAFVAHSETVDVVAEPAEGYHFTAWQEGDLVNGYNDIATTAEYTYTTPDATAAGLKAVFDTNVYNMNIAVADANDGMGTVTGPATVKHFLSGEFIATAETGYHFTGWMNEAGTVVSTLDTLVVEPVSDTTLYATFDTNTYTLTVVVADGQNDWGTVAGSQTVKHFLDYEISATPATCYEFVAWDDNDSTAARTVTLTSDSTITATFAYTVRASYDTLVVCDTLIWNGNTYTVSDDYAVARQTAEGCDSTANMNLTVKYSTESLTTVTECESYKWHDITYTMSTLAHFDTVNAVGCDSIANLNLTIHYNTVGEETVVTCDTMYIWNGITYISSTIGTWNGTNQYGCDSTATLNLTLNNNFTGTDVQQHCESFTWIDGITYNESTNTPTYVYQMDNGCDSTVTLDLTISNNLASTDVQTACESFTWIDGQTYSESTNTPTYVYHLGTGCDSTVTLDLTVNHNVEHSFDGATCTYYVWDGTYYDQTGSYSKTYTAANGCDSTATLNLTVSSSLAIAISESACGSYTWNGTTYTASGAYSQSFQSVDGCDSTVTLTLTVNQPTTATVTVNAGSSYTWSDGNGQTYTESGNYTYTTTGSNGCDSVTTLQLTINNAVNGVETMTACGSYTWNGTAYTESGEYYYSHLDNYGNTQVDTLHLTINNSVQNAISDAACNFYIWDGSYYSQSGEFTKTYTAANGCDSVVTLTLTINQPVTANISESACGSYTWNGVEYTVSSIYSQSFTAANGCDSTVNLTLNIKQPKTTAIMASACGSYDWDNSVYTESGSYTNTYTAANGCDSVVTLTLTINNPVNMAETMVACGSYTWNGTAYNAAGDYTYSHSDANGCTQVDTLHLTINNSIENAISATACNYYIWDASYYAESGSYTKHYTAANGCDSVVTLTLTVNQPTTASVSETACGSYTWNGVTYAASGAYSRTLTGSNGCDSTVTLTLTVNQPTSATVVASACDSYTWSDGNGETYTQSGNYTYTTTGANGCDSVTTLQLTVLTTGTSVDNVTACDSYTWIDGVTYTESTSTPTHTVNEGACNTVVTLNLTINSSATNAISETACEGYTWDGTFYNQSGDYTKSYTAANGCDSVVTLTLTVNQPTTATVTATACDSYVWNGTTYTATGVYTYSTTNSVGCDSVATLQLTVNNSTSGIETVVACDSYEWHGTTYTASTNTATYTTTGSNGCDSTTTLHLTINNSNSAVETVTACDSYEWHGTVYTASTNTPTYTTTGANGCDLVTTLNLTINNSVENAISETACEGYTWDGTFYNQSGNYTKSYTAANGCDSTVTLTLTVNQPTTATVAATACDSYEWNGQTYTATGVYTYSTTNSVGCDSVATLQLTVNNSTTAVETVTACDSYEWHGTTYTASTNTPTFTTTGANGCDSTTTLHLTINNSNTAVETVTACDSYEWHGTTYTESTNTPTYTTTGANGCDLTTTLNLTINSSVESAISETACIYHIWDGTYYNQSGEYSKTYTAANGCDSVVTLTLTVNQPVTTAISESACGSYTWNGVEYAASGVYTQTYTANNGCDSTVTLTLNVKQPKTVTVSATACVSYEWNGTVYTQSGNYTYTTTGSNGCDSTTTLQLTINNPVHVAETEVACNIYSWHGTVYTTSGDYTYSHIGSNGCTQVDTLHLTINTPVNTAETEVACGSYTWNGNSYTTSGNYYYSHLDNNGCNQVDTLHLTVNQPVTAAISESACGSYTWNGTAYTQSGTYTYTTTAANGCDSVTTLTLTINNPVHTAETEVACGSYSWHGTVYSESGNYTYSHTDANGCAQVDTLHLTVNTPVHTAETEVACGSYTWNGTAYTTSGNYYYSHLDNNGCTQVDTLHLTVNNPVYVTETETACGSYTWNGTVYTQSGIYTYTTTAANGCDSTVTLTLTVNQPTTGIETITACDSYTWNGTAYTASGEYSYSTLNANGCDSVATLYLTINHSATGTETATACDSYEWNGQTYTASGEYSYGTTTVAGCDSVVTLYLTVNYSADTALFMQGEGSIVWNNETFTESGVYERLLETVNGCDSTVTLTLAILPEGIPAPYLYNLMDVVLSINHNQEGLEDVHYVWYRWYRDGEMVLEGSDKDSYSEGGSKLNGCYYVEVATDESLQYWVRSNEICINSVGIDDVKEVSFTIAPNPVEHGSTVAIAVEAGDEDLQGAELRVYDVHGRMVRKQQNTGMIVADMPAGVYMVRLTLKDGRSTVSRMIVR